MSENNDSKIPSEHDASAGNIFNELIKSIKEKQNPKVGVVVNNADEQILVQNWLATKHSQDFFKQAQEGEYISIGVVHKINIAYNQINVGIINKWGLFGFVYKKEAKRFKEAQDGFKIGDIVLQKMNGTTIKSAKPLTLSKEMTLKVIDEIRHSHDQIQTST